MSAQTTFTAMLSATSSPASADGPTPSDRLAGTTPDLFGPDRAPVSRSALRESRRASPTSATSGPSGESLSASDRLQSSLESRLRERLHGSDLCEVTWSTWATPWGQCRSKPQARVRTTNARDFGLWPTADANNHRDPFTLRKMTTDQDRLARGVRKGVSLHHAAWLWATPRVTDARGSGYQYSQGDRSKPVLTLAGQTGAGSSPLTVRTAGAGG
jgi:hypothetical protein